MIGDSFVIPDNVLSCLATIMTEMRKIAVSCQADSEVAQAVSGCDISRFRNLFDEAQYSSHFNAYVEVETRGGRSLSWLLSIESTERYWSVDRSVEENRAEGPDRLVDLPDKRFDSFDEFVLQIGQLSAELTQTVTTFRFGTV